MQKWIRWKGLIAFLCVVGLIGLVWILFIDGMVKRNIEKYGTQAVGAKVELTSVDITLFPAGLELENMQVTNPDEPMENVVQISRIGLTLDTLNLFRRKIIIDEMALDGVRLNTPRKTSGAVASDRGREKDSVSGRGEQKEACQKASLPKFDKLDVKEILKNENLETLKLVESFQTDLDAEKKKWEARLDDLPNKEKFENYKKRIDKLKSGSKGGFGLNMLTSVGDAGNVAKEIKQDIDQLRQAKNDFDQALVDIKKRIEQAKNAPYEDFNRLKNKYGLSSAGLNNMSQLVLGAKLCG
jgi:uncharacterized protein (TIGR03545 family)